MWAKQRIRQIDEIESDRVLRYYGVALALIHLLTAYWLFDFHADAIIQKGSEPICWPLFNDCSALRIFSKLQIRWIFLSYGFLSIVVASLFLVREKIAWAYFGLVAINFFKLIVILIDFRLRLNQHYMGFVVTLVYLAVPQKRVAIRRMIVLIYFWSGIIKSNWGWISGDGLMGRLPFFKENLLVAACIYVLVLELVFVWGLQSKRKLLFWSCFLQFTIFHIISWWVVGFFYPLLMFALLSIFVFDRFEAHSRERAHGGVICANVLFSLLQIIPFVIPGDHTITGEGRFLSLHMFDAPHRCEVTAVLKTPRDEIIPKNFLLKAAPYRIACDPMVYYHRARNLCRLGRLEEIRFIDFDLVMFEGAKKNSLVNIKNFCRQNIHYHALRHNDWIAIY